MEGHPTKYLASAPQNCGGHQTRKTEKLWEQIGTSEESTWNAVYPAWDPGQKVPLGNLQSVDVSVSLLLSWMHFDEYTTMI